MWKEMHLVWRLPRLPHRSSYCHCLLENSFACLTEFSELIPCNLGMWWMDTRASTWWKDNALWLIDYKWRRHLRHCSTLIHLSLWCCIPLTLYSVQHTLFKLPLDLLSDTSNLILPHLFDVLITPLTLVWEHMRHLPFVISNYTLVVHWWDPIWKRKKN